MVIACCPVGPFFRTGFKAVRILSDKKYVRCCHGGTGQHKVGANYGLTFVPELLGNKAGY